jgi:hypothetical protein
MSSQHFAERIQEYKAAISQLPDLDDAEHIQYTVKRLEGLHFAPTLILPAENFTLLSKADILAEIDRVAGLFRARHASFRRKDPSGYSGNQIRADRITSVSFCFVNQASSG